MVELSLNPELQAQVQGVQVGGVSGRDTGEQLGSTGFEPALDLALTLDMDSSPYPRLCSVEKYVLATITACWVRCFASLEPVHKFLLRFIDSAETA